MLSVIHDEPVGDISYNHCQIDVFLDPSIFFSLKRKTGKLTRGHDFTLVKGQSIGWIFESFLFPRGP